MNESGQRCKACKGLAHPNSGGVFGPNNTLFCYSCCLSLLKFVKARNNTRTRVKGKKSTIRFGDHMYPPQNIDTSKDDLK